MVSCFIVLKEEKTGSVELMKIFVEVALGKLIVLIFKTIKSLKSRINRLGQFCRFDGRAKPDLNFLLGSYRNKNHNGLESWHHSFGTSRKLTREHCSLNRPSRIWIQMNSSLSESLVMIHPFTIS